MKALAGGTMAVLCIQGLLTAQLILDTATMTACFIADFEVICIFMDPVRGTLFPVVKPHLVCVSVRSGGDRTSVLIGDRIKGRLQEACPGGNARWKREAKGKMGRQV